MKRKIFSAKLLSLVAVFLGLVMLAQVVLLPVQAFAASNTEAFWSSYVEKMKASSASVAEKMFDVLTTLRADEEYQKYYSAIQAVNNKSLSDAQVREKLALILPGVDLSGLERDKFSMYLMTLPKATVWAGIVPMVLTIEAQANGATSLAQVQAYVTAQVSSANLSYQMLLAYIGQLGEADSKAQNLFDLISRIYVWPSFSEFQRTEKIIQVIEGVEYYTQPVETVLRAHQSPKGGDRTLLDDVGTRGIENRQAWDGLDYLVNEVVWLMDEDSTRVKEAIDVLYNQSQKYDQELVKVVDWQALGVSNVQSLSREQKLAKAKSWSVYANRSELSRLMGNLVCEDVEATEIDADSQCMLPWWALKDMVDLDPEISAAEDLGMSTDMILAWMAGGMYNDYIDEKYGGTACSEGDICEVMTRIKGLTIATDQHVMDGLTACNSSPVTPPDVKPGPTPEPEQPSTKPGAPESPETPKAPNTGNWLANLAGELTDLGAVLTVIGGGLAGILGLAVIVRLYTRKKF